MCVALVGYADMSDSYASAKDGLQPAAGKEAPAAPAGDAAKLAPAEKASEKKVERAAAKSSGAKREAHAAHKKSEKKPAAAAHKGDKGKKAAAPKAERKPAAPAEKSETKAASPSEPAEKPAAAVPAGAETKAQPAAEQKSAAQAAPAEEKKSGWWPFKGGDKAAEQKAAQAQAEAQARAAAAAKAAPPAEAKKPEPKPISKAWLDDNEKRLRTAVAGSKFAVERRGDLLVVVAPADAAFNHDRPNMLLPASLGPLSKMAKQVEGDAQSAVLVLGHGDGNAEADRKLSQERAQSVAAIFRMSGLKSDRLMLRGMGADKPLVGNDNAKGRAQNRRVEIILTQRDSLPALMAQNSH